MFTSIRIRREATMRSEAGTVEAYLDEMPDDRRAAIYEEGRRAARSRSG
jgi:hypothetical protein